MAEVTLVDALDRVRDSGVKERSEGLADLKHILRHNQHSNSFNTLGDASFHRIYEVLFKVVVSDRSSYLKAKTQTLRTAASNRLQACASALRLAVEVGVSSLKLKTVKALLDHFIETMPMSDGGVCDALSLDYSKAMRAVLDHQPHVEHLSKDEWERTVRFCIEYMQPAHSESFVNGGSSTFTSSRSFRSRPNNSSGSQLARASSRQVGEELVACLRLLTRTPNAPISSMAPDILWAVIGYLQATSASSSAHQEAFAVVSNVLSRTKTENIGLTRKATIPLIRLIRGYWGAKTSGLKDILMTSVHLQLFIQDQCSTSDTESIRFELDALLEALRSEYSKRQERDQLHLEDIRFLGESATLRQPGMVRDGALSLQINSVRAEQGWAIVYLMAFTTGQLQDLRRKQDSRDEMGDEDQGRPRKRQRIIGPLEDLLTSAGTGAVGSRIASLQTLTFLLQDSAFSLDQLGRTLDALLSCCGDENVTIASWALFAVTSCAYQSLSANKTLTPRWTSMWQLASRSMVNANTCRSACSVLSTILRLRLVSQTVLSELYQALSGAFELSGPSILCDTAIDFVRLTMAHSTATQPNLASNIANSVTGWLLRRWTPSKFNERTYAASCSLFQGPDLVALVAQSLGQSSHHSPFVGFPLWDTLGRGWLCAHEDTRLVSYLLSLPETPTFLHSPSNFLPMTATTTPTPRSSSETLILNHTLSELSSTVDTWTQMTRDRPRGINSDVLAALCQFLAASTCMAHCLRFSDYDRGQQIQQKCLALSKITSQYIASPACGPEKVDIMLTFLARHIWPPTLDDGDQHTKDPERACRNALALAIDEAMAFKTDTLDSNGESHDDDMMEMSNAHESQESRRARFHAGPNELFDDSSITHSAYALRSVIPLYASIVSANAKRETDSTENVSSTVMDKILSLPDTSILANRAILSRLSTLVPDLAVSDTERLLEFLTDHLIQAYTFTRSEVAIGTILDAMIGLKSFWMDPVNKNLANLGLDMYDWCISTALEGGVLSPNAQVKLATLLLQLCHVNTEYGHEDDVPSVRTSLFDLLRRGAISVQFHLAERISTIFSLFVLSTHDAMFDDLQKSLPAECEWIEGLAMRLLFLAKLASSWHSLLRQSIYYIFETAGRVDSSKVYATACVKEVATSLNFDSPRKLFRLFAPQLLHTWLEDQPLETLPYATFAFNSLHDMLEDVQTEITAQLLMRGLDKDMQMVAEVLGSSVKDLLRCAFGKSVAYAISRDIVLPTPEQGLGCEARLRNIIGSKEEYRQLCAEHYASVMGHFFLCMNQDDIEDNWMAKRNSYPAATKALAEMKGFSYSKRLLPPPQQPSFKGKWLPDQIERFCRRTGQDPSSPWEPSNFAVAARMLFDSLDPALGSLHNCTVLRKLRLLVATAGEVSITGYPLEMLLRGIKPYLTDSHCADDAVGLVDHLMSRGQAQLGSNAKLLCGIFTTMLLETRAHMGARQDSTTQETQHRETVKSMHRFYDARIAQMRECGEYIKPSLLPDYDVLSNALSRLQLPGNAQKDSPESALLLLLVRQADIETCLFDRRDSLAALAILTRNFQAPQSIAEDALDDDAQCIALAPALWRTIQDFAFDDHFAVWAGKAMGRAYAAGCNHDALQKTHEHAIRSEHPYVVIVQKLCELVLSPTRTESGLAEYVLRTVALELVEESQDEAFFRATLPSSLAPAILAGTYGYIPPAIPKSSIRIGDRQMLKESLASEDSATLADWVSNVALVLCRWPTAPSLLTALPAMLLSFPYLAMQLLPVMIHLILEIEVESKQTLQPELSIAIKDIFSQQAAEVSYKQDFLLDLLLYLRHQEYPGEHTKVDRLRWLEIDHMQAAHVASNRGKPTFALMMAESCVSASPNNRRTSSRASAAPALPVHVPEDLLLSIFQQVDEPDSFYGVEQPASLVSVLGRLDYEKSGFKSLMFRSAQVDSHMRQSGQLKEADAIGMVRSLSALNLSSLTYTLTSGSLGHSATSMDEMLESARKLQQWDTVLPESKPDGSSLLMSTYQGLSHATKADTALASLQNLSLQHVRVAQQAYASFRPSRDWLACLGLMTESFELTSSNSINEFLAIRSRIQSRETWMHKARFEDFDLIQQGRITTLSVLGRNDSLLKELRVTRSAMRTSEAQALLAYSTLARQNGQLQTALCAATQINDLALNLQETGIRIDAAAKREVASVLWDSQESTASVKMLREILLWPEIEAQDIAVGRSGLLAQLGKQLADARLEKPGDILENYLRPAIAHLPKDAVGDEAGKVYHTFAEFCDRQLQHPANVEDFNRIATLRQRKLEEVQELQAIVKNTRRSNEKREHENSLRKAEQWFKLDDEEYQHQKRNRETFVQQSLQNYLLALHASDEHNLSVLRFFALWLESSDSPSANETVGKHLPMVPSWKFVVLLNQLMSRLKNDRTSFQASLFTLLQRMCLTHPYHSVHHVYASTRSPNPKDEAAVSRYQAAASIRQQVSQDKAKGELFKRLCAADSLYRTLAEEPLHDRKTGKRPITDVQAAVMVSKRIPGYRLPPVTISLPLHPDGNYNEVPHVMKFNKEVSIMSGLSSPKVLTAVSSDGQTYKQLFKSGNDDLRQDAIMEQVFEEVSKMLQNHKATRQRNLHIRTYKVIPLSTRSGIIEFVPNSIPINEFLNPAHAKYYPQDWKNNAARERVRAVQGNSTDTRVKEFRKVCDHLHPVMRHFFLERFDDPDDWFAKRTAYTRTTASVSILGHVLGLGDRHGHNIMLDEKTGEVVHIDLGVAFEAGRVLPVPELVPFRLTRDIVDGMGVTKTEGIFRRCCEFTMDALREDKDSIMTLLNVLRYDPLYTWSVSPLRAKRMQDAQDGGHNAKDVEAAESSKAKMEAEGGEADRALAIVEKKLSKTLSTAATVNELIQQATDVKNLATLFAGWAAWF